MAVHHQPGGGRELLCHRLFFALLPPPEAVGRIGALRDGLSGSGVVADERLHLTLFVTADHAQPPLELVAGATRAAASAARPAVRVRLDHLVRGPRSTLLIAHEPAPALRLFQGQLQADLRRAGIRPRSSISLPPSCGGYESQP